MELERLVPQLVSNQASYFQPTQSSILVIKTLLSKDNVTKWWKDEITVVTAYQQILRKRTRKF